MAEQTQAQTVTLKVKTLRWIVAVAAVVGLGVAGQTLIPETSTAAPQTQPVAVQKPQTPCGAKKAQEPIPAKAHALCVVVAAQPAYATKQTGSPKGTVLVAECRKAAWQEHLEWGRKHAQGYVTSCLVNEHAMWWKATKEATAKLVKQQ